MRSFARSLPVPLHRRQRGVVLMVALIVLVALTLAGLSMVRSADSGVVIAGNLSFRQSAAHALDAGVVAAANTVSSFSNLVATGTAVTGKYYPYMLSNANADQLPDLPAGAVWYGAGNPANAYVISNPAGLNGYTVRYIVERMCFTGLAAPIATDLDVRLPGGNSRCSYEDGVSGSGKVGGPADLGAPIKLNYRVTVKVEGPRNTETFAQVVLSR